MPARRTTNWAIFEGNLVVFEAGKNALARKTTIVPISAVAGCYSRYEPIADSFQLSACSFF